MCGRYVLVQKIETLEKRFNINIPADFDFKVSYNISPGDFAPVITSEKPHELQLFQFGLTPFWAKKKMYLFNARAEGNRNKENDPEYNGAKDIINKPAFRKPIRSQRCLVPADAFIEGTSQEGLSKPYLVYLKNKERPFSFAGIYDTWLDKESGEELHSFSIITTAANSLLQKIPHHRCPLILSRSQEKYWLRQKTNLSDISAMLQPISGEKMNAYPIDSAIKNPKLKGAELIQPKGARLQDEQDLKQSEELKLEGMGNRKRGTQTKKRF
jgi:putative SOS response-associated peptidase YedK